MNILEKALNFILDMKNILSIGALALLLMCVNNGTITGEQAYTIILMSFTFFLGSKVNK